MYTRMSFVLLTLSFLAPTFAVGQGTITSNTGSFSLQNIPTSPVLDSAEANFIPNGGPDHVNEQWWWFRLQGDTRETPFHAGMAGFSQSYNANSAVLTFNQTGLFNAEMSYIILNYVPGFDPGTSEVQSQVRIANTSGAPLTLSVFNYHDFDVFGSGGDSAVMQLPTMRISDAGVLSHQGIYRANGASLYRAGVSGVTELGLFNANVDNFANDGLPFAAGNFSGGFQWNLTIPTDEIATLSATFAIVAVPEPSSMLLIGGSLVTSGWIAWRRQRAKAQAA
jgi:hypothetical protein